MSHKRIVELLAGDSLSSRPRTVSLAGQQLQAAAPEPPPPPRKRKRRVVLGIRDEHPDRADEIELLDGDFTSADLIHALQSLPFDGRTHVATIKVDREVARYLIVALLQRSSH
jgi:hypothetical protein